MWLPNYRFYLDATIRERGQIYLKVPSYEKLSLLIPLKVNQSGFKWHRACSLK